MPTFGFSAFLKMLSLSDRRQRSEMRKRLLPSDGTGYDFHRQFRLLAHRYLGGGEELQVLLSEAAGYRNVAEGRAAQEALLFLEEWRDEMTGRLFSFEAKTWESVEGVFKVKYTTDFGIEIDGVSVAIHLWKTKVPALDARMTYVALSLFAELYAGEANAPQDLAVLSVLDGRLYRLSDVADQSVLAERVMASIENLIDDLNDEITPPPSLPGDQPGTLG